MTMLFLIIILIDNLAKCFSHWLFAFYPDRCKVLKVAENTFKGYDYVVQNRTLKYISQEKDLGVIFNSRLPFDAHINDKADKIL